MTNQFAIIKSINRLSFFKIKDFNFGLCIRIKIFCKRKKLKTNREISIPETMHGLVMKPEMKRKTKIKIFKDQILDTIKINEKYWTEKFFFFDKIS